MQKANGPLAVILGKGTEVVTVTTVGADVAEHPDALVTRAV